MGSLHPNAQALPDRSSVNPVSGGVGMDVIRVGDPGQAEGPAMKRPLHIGKDGMISSGDITDKARESAESPLGQRQNLATIWAESDGRYAGQRIVLIDQDQSRLRSSRPQSGDGGRVVPSQPRQRSRQCSSSASQTAAHRLNYERSEVVSAHLKCDDANMSAVTAEESKGSRQLGFPLHWIGKNVARPNVSAECEARTAYMEAEGAGVLSGDGRQSQALEMYGGVNTAQLLQQQADVAPTARPVSSRMNTAAIRWNVWSLISGGKRVAKGQVISAPGHMRT